MIIYKFYNRNKKHINCPIKMMINKPQYLNQAILALIEECSKNLAYRRNPQLFTKIPVVIEGKIYGIVYDYVCRVWDMRNETSWL